MSAGLYVNDGGVTRKLKKLYTNVGGVTRELKELWVNDAGVARKIYQSVPPITWSRETGVNQVYHLAKEDCSFDDYDTLGFTVSKNDGTWGSYIEGICYAEYYFASPLYAATSDYLRLDSIRHKFNDTSNTLDFEIKSDQGTILSWRQSNDNSRMHSGDHIPFLKNGYHKYLMISGHFTLLSPSEQEPLKYADVELNLSLYLLSQGIDSFRLGPTGHN